MLTVISEEINDRGGIVVVQGGSQEEVLGPAARQLAINRAGSKGLSRAGTSGGEAAYPVNDKGETSDDVLFGRNGQKVAGFRCDYRVTGGL